MILEHHRDDVDEPDHTIRIMMKSDHGKKAPAPVTTAQMTAAIAAGGDDPGAVRSKVLALFGYQMQKCLGLEECAICHAAFP